MYVPQWCKIALPVACLLTPAVFLRCICKDIRHLCNKTVTEPVVAKWKQLKFLSKVNGALSFLSCKTRKNCFWRPSQRTLCIKRTLGQKSFAAVWNSTCCSLHASALKCFCVHVSLWASAEFCVPSDIWKSINEFCSKSMPALHE